MNTKRWQPKKAATKVSEERWWVVDDEGEASKRMKCKRECAYASLVVWRCGQR